jgi:cellulose synthase/poly-beta-1,6-N-acetylglucosamine synthase-like glycosyltransferase
MVLGDVLIGVVVALAITTGVLALTRGLLLAHFAGRHARSLGTRAPQPHDTVAVSVIVPAFNEATVIERTVRSLAASAYPDFEVIVVDDGSTDDTAAIVDRLGLPAVRVVCQLNTGKAGALNTAIRAARHDVIVSVDADTTLEPRTIAILARALAAPGMGAVAGNVKVANRAGALGRWQHLEYVVGFNLDRRLSDVLSCMTTVPGAAGAFRRVALEQVGLFSTDTLAEDTDITIALGRAGWQVTYESRAIAHTEAPASLRALWRQRHRWAYGTMQSVWKHRSAVRAGDEGHVGRRGLPYHVTFSMAMPLLAPSIDVLAVHGLMFGDPATTIGCLCAYNALWLALTAYALRLDGESPRALWELPIQQFAHRQMTCLVVARSLISALRCSDVAWQRTERVGDVTATVGDDRSHGHVAG